MKSYVSLLLLSLIFTTGCCRRIESDPARPNQVRGWQELVGPDGIKTVGEFVLKKGESVNNGKLGVEVANVIPGRTCQGTESMPPNVRWRFFRVKDKSTILEIELTGGSGNISGFEPALWDEFGISMISAKAINTKDGWVWFELWK